MLQLGILNKGRGRKWYPWVFLVSSPSASDNFACACCYQGTVVVIVLGVISVGGWKEGIRTGTAEEVINTISSRVF